MEANAWSKAVTGVSSLGVGSYSQWVSSLHCCGHGGPVSCGLVEGASAALMRSTNQES